MSRLWHSDNQSFNPRSPRGGATLDIIRKAVRHAVSIHAPHEGERRAISINYIFHIVCFNPRSPRGGATGISPLKGSVPQRFNPRSPRGGATVWLVGNSARDGVSIHAPHEGERHHTVSACAARRHVSIHAPHEGERRIAPLLAQHPCKFQSTLPTRGSDHHRPLLLLHIGQFQSTLPTRGSDAGLGGACMGEKVFQSTLPTRGSDQMSAYTPENNPIVSIHAPHEGERLFKTEGKNIEYMFQSTLPTRGSDGLRPWTTPRIRLFQSTLPTRGSDRRISTQKGVKKGFNPRSPRGGATG